jgi:hypothetical protein
MLHWWVLVLLLWSDETEERNEGDMLKLSYTWTETLLSIHGYI